ncbi:MAG: winged helix DNA-binding protein [Eubacterium sp.]|nr:winged helix DNA-binding protein [Eubacterium sp.]MCI9411134.1 winged helix DNA-binding protein [Eubacterium sp.]
MSEKDFLNTANPMVIMIFINQMHRKKMERLLEGTGLHRAQHRLLMTLSEGKFESQAELAAVLEISTATVAVSLKKLERDGYIQKTTKKDDSRAKFVSLTEKGEDVVARSREIFAYMDQSVIRGFSEEELVTLRKFLKQMYDNVKEIE